MPIDPRSNFQAQAPRADLRVNGVNPTGKVVTSAPQTDATGFGVPDFLMQLVEPMMQRKQQELVYKGYTEQAAKRAEGGVLDDETGVLGNIFGPSYYQEGAAMYEAQKRLQDNQAQNLAEIDTLKQMTPDELAKKLAADGQKLMTGNPWADKIIQQGLMNTMGPTIDQVTRARVAWQQQTAVDNQVDAIDKAATNLQTLASNQALFGTATDGSMDAVLASKKAFLGLMAKPEGQLDESHRKSIVTSLRMSLDKGNLYAFELLKDTGILGAMTATDAEAIERMYDSKARQAMHRVATTDKGVLTDLMSVKTMVEKNKSGKLDAGNASDAMGLLARANAKIMAATGSKTPLFDLEDFEKAGGDIIAAQFEAQRRADAKWEARRDVETKKLDEAAAFRAAAETAANIGGLKQAYKQGYTTEGVADALIATDIKGGRFDRAYLNFKTDGYASPQIKDEIKASLDNSLGKGYTNDVGKTISVYRKMSGMSIGMAQSYFGPEYSARVAHMVRAIDGGANEQQAYEAVMGDKTIGTVLQLDPGIRKEADKLLDQEVKDSAPGWFSGTTEWNPSTLKAVKQHLTQDFAIGYKNLGVDPKTLAQGTYEAAKASGRLEVLGGFYFGSPQKRTPLAQALKVPEQTLDKAMFQLADERLKSAGYTAGAKGGSYSTIRAQNNNIIIIAHDANGVEKQIAIRADELYGRSQAIAKGVIAGNQAIGRAIHGNGKSLRDNLHDSLH
ncbi:internal virion protein [Caulobacter phage DCM]|uniref:Internal virion protein n=1 Tax=Caulobacter phage DCM TaxID=3020391 RepID=A0AAE9WWR2_9CAUD|nr:internal virion protein [Caulobacter phage DCM]WCD56124.1 internal virion protein [Caulobacter phage BL199]